MRVVTNRPRIGRDGTTYPAIAHDRSELLFARRQETTLADWYADSLTGTIEVRIPWGMLHVLDPSSRMVLRGNALTGRVAGLPTVGFRFVVQTFDPADPSRPGDRLPRGDPPAAFGDVALWRWPMWEEPRWYPEVKPQFEMMRTTFGEIPNLPHRRPSRPRPIGLLPPDACLERQAPRAIVGRPARGGGSDVRESAADRPFNAGSGTVGDGRPGALSDPTRS